MSVQEDVKQWGDQLRGLETLNRHTVRAVVGPMSKNRLTDLIRAVRGDTVKRRQTVKKGADKYRPVNVKVEEKDPWAISRWDTPDTAPPPAPADFEPIGEPEQGESIEDILARQEKIFEAKARVVRANRLPKQIKMPPGPYAIVHFGDDHLDDDGCDIASYRKALRVVGATPGMYGGAVGDLLNNWPDNGNLAQLYGHQHATKSDGWRLAEWSMKAIPWVYRVLGNHDMWARGGTIMHLLARGAKIGRLAASEVKLELLSPGVSQPIRIHARHEFRGHSQWNRVHGPVKKSKLDPWADLYIDGHKHEWAMFCEEGEDNRIRWMMRARGFKFLDSYAHDLGFTEHRHGETITTVIQPGHAHPFERIRCFLDIDEAADCLTYLRKKAGV